MEASSPLSPVVATPLAHRKRRHSEVELATDDGEAAQPGVKQPAKGEDPKQSTPRINGSGHPTLAQSEGEADDDDEYSNDDDSDEEDHDFLENILDTAELQPYQPDDVDDGKCLKPEAAARYRARLLQIGPERFFAETMPEGDLPLALLGSAFGLDPHLEHDLGREIFLRILSHAIIRFYRKRQKLQQYNTIDDAANLLKKSNSILVVTGAGISTSLGIPDFRSKGTGFYSQLVEDDINEPEEVFDIELFDEQPETFYKHARGLLPDETRFSPTHGFIRLLQDKGKLQTNYTQNIDNIEERAGIDRHRLIQCHGSFATASCRKCKYQVKGTEIFGDIRAQRVARCKRCIEDMAIQQAHPKKKAKTDHQCFRPRDFDDDDNDSTDYDIPSPGVMKPDITFFGEQLPDTFFDRLTERDSKNVDLVLVIGTSLKVAPVSEIPNYLPHQIPHIYVSREPIEHVNFDVQLLGDCDTVVFELCRRAGWNLKHDMLSEGLKVVVDSVEGSECRWNVRAISEAPAARFSAVNGEDLGRS